MDDRDEVYFQARNLRKTWQSEEQRLQVDFSLDL